MELRDYLAIARKWAWLFALATAVAAVGAWVTTKALPRTYASQTTLMVGRPTSNPDPNYQQLFLGQTLATTYAQMATREPVLQGVIDALGLEAEWQQLRGMVKAEPVAGSQLLEIRVADRDPVRARVLADTVAEQLIAQSPTPDEQKKRENRDFVEQQITTLRTSVSTAEAELTDIDARIGLETSARAIADLQNRKSALLSKLETWRSQYGDYLNFFEGSEVNSLAIIEKAAPGAQVGPNVKMNVMLAAAIGFGLALAAVLLLEYLDDTVKTPEQMQRRLGLTGLATIERIEGVEHRRDTLVTVKEPRSPVAEAYRVLRTNLQFALMGKPGIVVVSSPNPGEGKTATAANLAVALAQGGKKVVLVDADLRKPAVHRVFELPNGQGLTSLLVDESLSPQDVLQPIPDVPGQSALTSGPLPPNPAEMLDSKRMDDVLEVLGKTADYVVLDTPPLLVVVDAAILARDSDGTLLVFDSGATRVDTAKRAIEVLARVGVRPFGSVINRLDRERVGGYYYYYAYRERYGDYYGSSGEDDDTTLPPSGPPPRTPFGTLQRVRQGLAERVASALSS